MKTAVRYYEDHNSHCRARIDALGLEYDWHVGDYLVHGKPVPLTADELREFKVSGNHFSKMFVSFGFRAYEGIRND